jgi:hypothetical protein
VCDLGFNGAEVPEGFLQNTGGQESTLPYWMFDRFFLAMLL